MRVTPELEHAVRDFLAQKRIAVAGVSRKPNEAANVIYRKLRDAGHQVFAVNPKTDTVEGTACHRSLAEIQGGVGAVVVATHPDVTTEVVRQCIELGISRVWMHRSFGQGSVCDEAVALGEEHGLRVIAGGCPMMFCPPVDLGHRCMRFLLQVTGGLPKAA